ncbi:MAG: ATP-dependent zinc metalloprotease FtsH [Holosporales bacterium]|jgi:cell division protease FtsH|nr:ATP-dependent zinc metalloprotease FtsH [Holosporales bacterium]
MKRNTKNILSWIILIGILFLLANPFDGKFLRNGQQELSYSQFMKEASNGNVKEVLVRNSSSKITGLLQNGKIFSTITPNDLKMIDKLLKNDVEIKVDTGESGWGFLISILIQWFPIILLVGLMIYSSRQMQSGGKGGIGGGALGLGKAKAKMFQAKKVNVTFADVAGIDEAKQELEEIVDFLKSPQKFQRLGGKIPRGVLLVGDPGNGKTLLARAIAGEANAPFFSISGSDFVEVFVGVGASRVRDMFENAKKHSPCIVFIDEIDAVGRRRDSSMRGGNDEREQTLNQLLVEMDGFDEKQSVIVLAATNRADILDPALLRPGRFDRKITVEYPDMAGREKILKVHSKDVPLSPDVNLKTIARGTPGFSGAELANLVNEAALLAAKKNNLSVSMKDFEMAKDRVMMGAERKSMSMTNEEKKNTAYHEAGHALIALLVPQCDPIHKVTIIPRGGALGMVVRLPEKDKFSITKTELLSNIKVALGGRVAEEMIFGEENITTGASQDIKQATKTAKNMIIKWGMSDDLGLRSFYDSDGYYLEASDQISQTTSETMDKEIKKIIDAAYNDVKKMMTKHRDKLEIIAQKLIEYETLTGEEVKLIFEGKELQRKEEEDNNMINEFKLGGLPNSSKGNSGKNPNRPANV